MEEEEEEDDNKDNDDDGENMENEKEVSTLHLTHPCPSIHNAESEQETVMKNPKEEEQRYVDFPEDCMFLSLFFEFEEVSILFYFILFYFSFHL